MNKENIAPANGQPATLNTAIDLLAALPFLAVAVPVIAGYVFPVSGGWIVLLLFGGSLFAIWRLLQFYEVEPAPPALWRKTGFVIVAWLSFQSMSAIIFPDTWIFTAV